MHLLNTPLKCNSKIDNLPIRHGEGVEWSGVEGVEWSGGSGVEWSGVEWREREGEGEREGRR